MPNDLDKIVKLACKPKNAPPKAKYVDVLVSATFSDDGSLQDIVRSLSLRLREPNAVVVFKALLTLHQMIRSGSTDNFMEVLAQGDSLRLRNVSGQNWEGYAPPSSLGAYAKYLDARIKVWKELKQDPVRVQTESNRRSDGLGAGSKARRLRHLPVEKGLLREVKQVQSVLMVLIACRFFDDDLRDENTILAFRMLIKDLLVLFQAGNEGVCNILEHYFEMSKTDATEAFSIYKQFITQTDKVVDYLSIVRKLNNVVNVPVPNLKHAPTSLVKALEEYLNDPNFEENRREYKRSLGVVEGNPSGRGTSPAPKTEPPKPTASSTSAPSQPPAASASAASAPPPGASQKIQDFFESIQADQQPTMFGGPSQPFQQQQQFQQMPFQQTGMPPQQQPAFNPFRQSMMMPQQTGFMQPQQTGFMQPQQTGFNPFGQPQQQQPFQMQQNGAGGGLQPQLTGMMAFGTGSMSGRGASPFQQPQQQQQQQQPFGNQPNFAQPQPQPLLPQSTGSNPFRQSMFMGGNMNPSGALSQPTSPFQNGGIGGAGGQNAFGGASAFGVAGPSAFNSSQAGSSIQRPGSTPASSNAGPKPLVPQATGSKNPFAPPGGIQPAPPTQPKGPSMNELAWQKTGQQSQGQFSGQSSQTFGAGGNASSPWGSNPASNGQNVNSAGGEGISNIASSFIDFGKSTSPSASNGQSTNGSTDFLSQFGSMSMNTTGTPSTQFNSLSSNPTGQSSLSPSRTGATSPSSAFLQPQKTGMGGSTVKRFQPTSSFGSQLLETLPPIAEPTGTPGSNAATPMGQGVQAQSTGYPFGQQGQQQGQGQQQHQQGQEQGQQQGQQQGLAPQMTGGPNPFRQSMFGAGGLGGMSSQPTGQAGGAFGGGAFGGSAFGGGAGGGAGGMGGMGGGMGAFGANSPFAGQNRTGQQQQPSQPFGSGQQGGSLI